MFRIVILIMIVRIRDYNMEHFLYWNDLIEK